MKNQKIVNVFCIVLMFGVAPGEGDEWCNTLNERECINLHGVTRCYFDYPESSHVGFQQAKRLCECNGLKMAMAQDEQIMKTVMDINFDFWMDLRRSELDKLTFVQSGLEMELSVLKPPGHINTKKLEIGEENHLCAYVTVYGARMLKYGTDSCSVYRKSLCRLLTCTGENCSLLSSNDTFTTWYRHRYACHLAKGDLAFSDNEQSLSDLIEKVWLEQGEYWIGLHREKWTWGDGTEMVYSYWDYTAGQPSTLSEECVVARSDRHSTWIDLKCSENSGVLCYHDAATAGDIPRNTQTSERGSSSMSHIKPNEATPEPSTSLPPNVIYALAAVSSVCGLLIIILATVLTCTYYRRSKRNRRVPDYYEIDDLAVASFTRTRTQTCSTECPPDGAYEGGEYLQPISYTDQPGEPVYSVIDYGTQQDCRDNRYLAII